MDDLNISEDYGFVIRNLIRSGFEGNFAEHIKDTLRTWDNPTDSPAEVIGYLTQKGYEFGTSGLSMHAKAVDLMAHLIEYYTTLPSYNILVVSTASILTPPERYGGMERMVDYLSRGLSFLGHHVQVVAKTKSTNPFIIATAGDEKDFPEVVSEIIDEFDIVIDLSHDKRIGQTYPEKPQLNVYQVMSVGHRVNPVFISYGQKRHTRLNGPVVHYGLRLEDYPVNYRVRDDYLLYMGSIIPEKRVEWAIDVALKMGRPIKIAGPHWEPDYWKNVITPLLKAEGVDYVGDVGGERKLELLQNAFALIHPVGGFNWVEAGAIIAQESNAVGTPVVATTNGCLPEYIRDGENGYMSDTPDGMVEAMKPMVEGRGPTWFSCRKATAPRNWFKMSIDYHNLATDVLNGQRWTGG